jgi:ubiquinone/menaquinone biosynthesis C-methylase UbiE
LSLAPFVPSPFIVIERMLQIAGVKPGETVYDLGCGNGRILITAAQKFGAKAVGIELNESLAHEAQQKAKELNLESMVTVIHGNFQDVDISPADVVTLYLTTSANTAVKPNLEKKLRRGTRVVSHDFEIIGWKAVKVEEVAENDGYTHTIYYYRRP